MHLSKYLAGRLEVCKKNIEKTFQSEWEEMEHGSTATRGQRKQWTHTKDTPTLSRLYSHVHTLHVKQQGSNDLTRRECAHTHTNSIYTMARVHTHTLALLFSPPMGGCRSFHENKLLMNFPVGSSCSWTTLESSLQPVTYSELVCCFHSKQAEIFKTWADMLVFRLEQNPKWLDGRDRELK